MATAGVGHVWTSETMLLDPVARPTVHARSFCAVVMGAHVGVGDAADDLIRDAQLVASELVTNATNAGCTSLSVDISVRELLVRLAIFDNAAGLPEMVVPTTLAEKGRGLMIVNALAARWGVEALPTGKVVWADFSLLPVVRRASGEGDQGKDSRPTPRCRA